MKIEPSEVNIIGEWKSINNQIVAVLTVASGKYGAIASHVGSEFRSGLEVGQNIINGASTGIGLVDWAKTTFSDGMTIKDGR